MSTSAIQKVGSEKVVSEVVTIALSKLLPLFLADSTPKKIPITIAKTDDTPSNNSVLTSLPVATISYVTGLPVWNEVPKLKVTMAMKYFPNLVHIGQGIMFPLLS